MPCENSDCEDYLEDKTRANVPKRERSPVEPKVKMAQSLVPEPVAGSDFDFLEPLPNAVDVVDYEEETRLLMEDAGTEATKSLSIIRWPLRARQT